MVVHGAADIQQHQYLDIVLALRPHPDVEVAGIVGRRADRVIECQLIFHALPRELAQAAQRDLDVARAEFAFVVVIAIGARFPHLDRAAVTAFSADADAFGILAAVAER